MPTYGDTYCRVCDLPIARCVLPIPGMGIEPEGAEWLHDAVVMFPSSAIRAIRPHDSRCQGMWVLDDDSTLTTTNASDASVGGTLCNGDSVSEFVMQGRVVPLHRKCAEAALHKWPRTNTLAHIQCLPAGMWKRFQEQFFMWSCCVPGVDETICNSDALDTWLQNRLSDTASVFVAAPVDPMIERVVREGQWNGPGTWRATRCLCDSCDASTADTGCYSKFGMDICGECAAKYPVR